MLIFSALRGLSPGAPVFPSPEKPNANSLWKSSPMNDTGDTHRATSLSVLRSVKFTPLRHHLLLFFFYCLSKNCFLPVDLARLYQGTTNLGQNRWKNNIPLPTPNQGWKKTWCISSFFYCCLSKKCFRLWTLPG